MGFSTGVAESPEEAKADVELGLIEGYFGRPWRWSHAERKVAAAGLRALAYRFFHYAPKADAFLRWLDGECTTDRWVEEE